MQSTKYNVWLILGAKEMIVERIKRVTLLSLDFPPSCRVGMQVWFASSGCQKDEML